jgi:hypothetical protein
MSRKLAVVVGTTFAAAFVPAVGELELARRSSQLVGKKRLTLKPSRRYRAHLRKASASGCPSR